MMPVEVNQWRATMQISSPSSKLFRPISVLVQVFRLFCFYYGFVAISMLILPLVLLIQFLALPCVATQLRFFPLFARMHHFAKIVLYVTAELLKRIPFGVITLVRHKNFALKQLLSQYAYFDIACIACFTLHMQWLAFRTILLSGDVETNPGPETLDFCCWNLNSITAHDFLRVSLIEAYNSVFNYDLIGIVETHLDSTVEKDEKCEKRWCWALHQRFPSLKKPF